MEVKNSVMCLIGQGMLENMHKGIERMSKIMGG